MNQLSLFQKKRSGKILRPPPAPEFAVHCLIADLLRMSIMPGWVWFHTPNGGERAAFINAKGKRVSPEGGRLKRMGVKPGVSDFLLIGPPNGQLHALELKRLNSEPTEDQYAFLDAVEAAGGKAAWCNSFDGAVKILTRWGAVRVAA